jgi:glycosyltransferase involved in cell wall biosynthesis
MKNMKILMASHYFASHKGGVEIVAEALFQGLTDQNQQVVWMAGNASQSPQAIGRSRAVSLPISNFVEEKTGLPFPIPAPAALRTIIREVWNADILVLHDCLYLSNILAFLAAKWRGIPIVVIQHSRYFPNGTRVINAIMKISTAIVTHPMLLRSSQVVFIGETTMQSYARLRYKCRPELIFNGVNTTTFCRRGDSESVSKLRAKYHLHENRTTILFVGRFVEKKGLLVIRRMANLRPDWTWVLAGWGPIDPNTWNLANVRTLSGLDDPSIAELYRCSDLLVLPSSGEGGLPLVVREALVTGLPVVCGEETLGLDRTLGAHVTGVPVYLGNEERTAREFVTGIEHSLRSDAERHNHAEARSAFAISYCSWHRATEQYLRIISRLVHTDALDPRRRKGNTARQSL